MHRFIKAVGAGQKRARALTREEAREAMGLIASGKAAAVQEGAFLLALRMKGESTEELAGFVDALSPFVASEARRAPLPDLLEVDAHGDGHGDLPSLLPAAACAAAALGVPVCLSLERGSAFARHGLDEALVALGFASPASDALDPARAARDLARAGVAACDLAHTCPPLSRLVSLRPLLGVRSVAQTVAKLVSSLSPPPDRRLLGVFHAPYLVPTAAALGLLGTPHGLVAQALGGLPEARPGRSVRVARADGSAPRTVDLRAFADDAEPGEREHARSGAASLPLDGAGANLRALDGEPHEARRAAAAAALLLHAATDAEPLAAAEAALAALTSGRARAIADRLRAGTPR